MEEGKAKVSERKLFNGFLTLHNLRDLIILAVLIVITWKLVSAEFKIDLSNFNFSDFLSLTMSIFAISLAVAFFFKASDTSNKFYDNVYKFTKEVSEILGRIEAGFGERLRHIDEGYSGLREKFENLPFDLPSAKQQEEEEKKEIEQKEAKFKEILNSLMERAQLAEEEKSDLLSRLEESQQELETSKRELRRLQRDINDAELILGNEIHPQFIEDLAPYITKHIPRKYLNIPIRALSRKFSDLISQNIIPPPLVDYMREKK